MENGDNNLYQPESLGPLQGLPGPWKGRRWKESFIPGELLLQLFASGSLGHGDRGRAEHQTLEKVDTLVPALLWGHQLRAASAAVTRFW